MPITKVIHIKNKTGSPDEIYIGRPSEHQNPFSIDNHNTRSQVIAKYEIYFIEKLLYEEGYGEKIRALYGKTLVCFCSPKRCHGDIIAYWANMFDGIEDIFWYNNNSKKMTKWILSTVNNYNIKFKE